MAQCKRSIQTVVVDYKNYDRERTDRDLKYNREAIANGFRAKNDGELVGKIIRWQVADGYAEYMIEKEKPLVLVHLADFDAWTVPPETIRGLRLSDAKAKIATEEAFMKIFAKS